MTTWTKEEQAENRRALVAALRSGKYKQGKNVLAPLDGTFCCLGVACELAVAAGVVSKGVDEDGLIRYGSAWDCSTHVLPGAVREWLGFSLPGGFLKGMASSLAGLNDFRGYTFDQIADVIEQDKVELVGDYE